MKKWIFIFVILCVSLLLSCGDNSQTLQMLYTDGGIEKVDKIILKDGTTGDIKTITKEEDVDKFLEMVNNIEFSPQKNQ